MPASPHFIALDIGTSIIAGHQGDRKSFPDALLISYYTPSKISL